MELKDNSPQVKPSKDRKPVRKGAFSGSGNPHPRRQMDCAHCQRLMNDFAGGYSRGYNNEPLCHPNAKDRPDCYKLVTVYKHPTPCTSQTCYEDHSELMTYVIKYETEEDKEGIFK